MTDISAQHTDVATSTPPNGLPSTDETTLASIPQNVAAGVEEFRSAWNTIVRESLKQPLESPINSATVRHGELIAEVERAAVENTNVVQVFNEYVLGVRSDVLLPLFGFFSDNNIAEFIGNEFQNGLTHLSKIESQYPSELVVEETRDIYFSSPSDGWSTSFRKRAARLKRFVSRRKKRMRRIPVFASTLR